MAIEQDIKTLEEALNTLESEEINLDDAVDTYANTLKLATKTLKKLNQAQDKITILQKQHDELIQSSLSLDAS